MNEKIVLYALYLIRAIYEGSVRQQAEEQILAGLPKTNKNSSKRKIRQDSIPVHAEYGKIASQVS
jgi:hypothetical protein